MLSPNNFSYTFKVLQRNIRSTITFFHIIQMMTWIEQVIENVIIKKRNQTTYYIHIYILYYIYIYIYIYINYIEHKHK